MKLREPSCSCFIPYIKIIHANFSQEYIQIGIIVRVANVLIFHNEVYTYNYTFIGRRKKKKHYLQGARAT